MSSMVGSATVPTVAMFAASVPRYDGTPLVSLSTAVPTGITPRATVVSSSTGSRVTMRSGVSGTSTVPRTVSIDLVALPALSGAASVDEHAVAVTPRAAMVSARAVMRAWDFVKGPPRKSCAE